MRDSATPPWMGGGRGGGSPWSLLRGVIVLLLWSVAAPTARGQNIEKQEFRITEESRIGTLVGSIRTRPGFTYSFNQEVREFSIDAASGEIRTAGRVDREATADGAFDLVVISSSPTYPIQVRIVVGDINDSPPVFPASYAQLSFSESSPKGSRVILDVATDRDVGNNGQIIDYFISSGNEDGKFELKVSENPSSQTTYLYLMTLAELDAEDRSTYLLNLTAVDNGVPALKGSMVLSISVLDVNDNAPVFVEPEYSTTVNETAPTGSFVVQVSATDLDSGENSRVSYSLQSDLDWGSFSIDADTGVITTSKPNPQCQDSSCQLQVIAADHGVPRQVSQARVRIQLTDANDHSPKITFRYFPDQTAKFATVEENAKPGSLVAAITVTDLDKGANGKTGLEIARGNEQRHFRLDSRGDIHIVRVETELDRETTREYNLTVIAYDSGIPSRTSTSFLIILVNDVNDHAPQFTATLYTAVLDEAAVIGTFVAAPLAVDQDTGVNSNIYYSIVEGNDDQWFEIQHQSGLITTRMSLDRERRESVVLKVSARDGGTNPKFAATSVQITLLDVNDVTPTFAKDQIALTVSEHSSVGTKVATLTAVDTDKGSNGTVQYAFADGQPSSSSSAFRLDSKTGDLTVNSDLDREKTSEFDLEVIAKDFGLPALTSTVSVKVTIGDINDNIPVFYPRQYFVVLQQDFPVDDTVVQLRATDRDEGINAVLIYEMIEGNSGLFRLDRDSGRIYLNKPVSQLRNPKYILRVSAKDGKGRKSATTAEVEIEVDNSSLEYFSCTEDVYKFEVTEDSGLSTAKLGRQVGSIALRNSNLQDVEFIITDGNEDDVFSISKATGVIITQKEIDREVSNKFILKINARSGSRPISGVCIAEVSILDLNDNSPIIGNNRFLSVREDSPVNQIIETVLVEDLDEGQNGVHEFRLTAPSRFFEINEASGAIKLSRPLEERTADTINLSVQVNDLGTPRLETSFEFRIEVVDVNDHTPYFDQESYELSVQEDILVNSKLYLLRATDSDLARNGQIDYTILAGDNRTFGIFPDGNLYLKMALDRETGDYYSLLVGANDNGLPQRSSTMTLTIHVSDINDNAPKFVSPQYGFSVRENEDENTFIGKIHAEDEDIGRNAELSYSLEENQKYFRVEAKTGFILTKTSLDREKLISDLGSDSISFEVIVTDNGLPKRTDTASVTVQVYDENDNTPEFTSKTYSARISENTEPGSEVTSVFAVDDDLNNNGEIRYSITSGDRTRHFTINSTTGTLYLDKPVDRELVDTYVLSVLARDGGTPAKTSTATVRVSVQDENDNRPEITNKDLQLTLAEDATIGQEVFRFYAKDKDLGENADIRFSLGDSGYQKSFRIDSFSGILYLQKPLDYEKDKLFTLTVTASDQGLPQLSDSVTLKVKVTDVNDNAPKFPNTAIVRQIQEEIGLNTPILTIEARDEDSGSNGRINYSLAGYEAGSSEKFSIDALTGVIKTVGNIDREEVDTYKFTVVATDNAEPSTARLSSEKIITIIIEDTNDNTPEFESVPVGIINLGSQVGKTILTVQATDADTNSNGLVTYKLQQESFLFNIDHYSGEIGLKNRPETLETVYEVVVVASDEAVQSDRRSATATLTILGLARQDAGPGFRQEVYSVNMQEETGEGVSLVKVGLKDGSPADFYILDTTADGGNHRNLFRIDRVSGELSTLVNIDREKHGDSFYLNIMAVQGNTVSKSKVRVAVEDLNDSPPKFQNSPLIKFSENTLPGELIFNLNAVDADKTGTIKYSVVDGDAEVFSVNEDSGSLTLLQSVDRERRAGYQLTVRASDGNQFSDISLILTVLDENDNIPEFTSNIFSFDLYETSPKGTLVGKVSASDPDSGENSQLNYNIITQWGNEVFSLDPASGVLTLTSELDYERDEHYIFVVSGADNGDPQLSSTVTVYVNVKDINDNSPEFASSSYSGSVAEDIAPGVSIMDVSATDADSGDNGNLEYSIIGEAEDFFSVLSNGTLVSSRGLDRELQASYSFIVKAVDGGKSAAAGRNSATATVKLDLEDINDSVPTFTSPAEGFVTENRPPNTVVMSVTTVDADEGDNAAIEYFITSSDSDNFDIGRLDGILRTKVVLDRESKSLFQLTVTAMDMGKPRLSASMEIKIHVVDTNDNTPIFKTKVYSTTVLENATVGQNIHQTTAVDADEGLNGNIRYTIVSGDKTRDFTIGEHSGILRVNRQLDFERKTAYQLTIQAEDAGTPVKYDTASVSIYIEDVNDSPPKFRHSPYTARVIENQEDLPRYMTRVAAEDPDNPPHNLIKYSLKENFGNRFSINSSTGDVFIHSALDREVDTHFQIHVVAVDTGYPRLSSTGTLSVLVEDLNDNPPTFHQNQYTGSIRENTRVEARPILRVLATDPDTGDNGRIRYSLSGADSASFRLEADGRLYAAAEFDREEKDIYAFSVVAEDSASAGLRLQTSATVTITIQDENDNVPELRNGGTLLNVPQDIKTGDFVYALEGYDADSGRNGQITFRLTGRDAGRFQVEPSTGLVRTAGTLVPGSTYSLDLEVRDNGEPTLASQSSLTIKTAERSMFPAFTSSVSQIFVVENEISADLPQLEANGLRFRTVVYSILAGNPDDSFRIHPQTGKLSMQKPLDYEKGSAIDLYIAAWEEDRPEFKVFHKLEVKVEDQNDNAPAFESVLYSAEVAEESYPPVRVVKVSASDRDGPGHNAVRYAIKDAKYSEVFEVDEVTGEISTIAKLDREIQDEYEFEIEATDDGTKALSGSTLIKVKVEDINDNPPRFTRILSINITEDSVVGSILATVETIDKDVGQNANVTYEFSENSEGKFEINPLTGDITLVGQLDRELKEEYLLKVVATDGAWRAETTVGISVQDVNDNSPEFEEEDYVFTVPSSTSSIAVIGRVIAHDLDDSGPNSQIVYSLRESSEFFSVDSTSGEILTRKKLENLRPTRTRTVENEYLLQVIAEDSGQPPLSSTVHVKVLVMDENLGSPVFLKRDYTTAIPVSARPGIKVVQVEAVDNLDTGLNAEIEYAIAEGPDARFFEIDPVSGWIQLSSDIESRAHTLRVIGRDKGVPPLSAQIDVRIMPSGENRHAPIFSVTNTQIIIPENEPLGSSIIKLKASDQDAGINGIIRYGIVGGNDNGFFGVDELSGQILIRKQLDFDADNGYILTVEARDLGFVPKSASATLNINLTDVNDNVPFFEQAQYDAYLEENQPAGTQVIRMEAIDLDSARYATVIYSIVEPQMLQHFRIDSSSGVISSDRSFDFEKESLYRMQVSARNPDSGEFNTTDLNIHITGNNEFFPRFQQPVFQFAVSESALANTEVGRVLALDQDAGPEGDVYYFLVGQSNDHGFYIEKSTGVIYVKEILDREVQNRFVLTVLAKNEGSILGNDTDEAQVIIQVQDGNDPPVFRKDRYESSAAENVELGSVVAAVSAVDRDVRPRNSQFSYSILGGNVEDSFEIDPSQGTIRTIKYLDREKLSRYELIVAAIDNGSPPQTGTTQVLIRLSDVNDNPPFLDVFNRRGTLKENSAENTLAAKLQPSDEDLPPNAGPFTFSLVGGKHQNFFKVDKASGDIRSLVKVDRELTPELEIEIEITDSGSPPLASKYLIKIDVLDENDNPSQPRQLTVLVQTLNGVFAGGVVAPVRPKDPDTTGDYKCKIKSGATKLFQMKPDCYLHTGRLVNVEDYNLTVIGNDGIHDSVTSQVYLTFDKFDAAAQDMSLVIRIHESLAPPALARLFRLISFHGSSAGRVQVLSIVKDENNTDFFVAIHSNREYVSKQKAKAVLLTELSFVSIVPGVNVTVGYDPCLSNPCQNSGFCSTSTKLQAQTVIVEAEDIILNSPKFVQKVECACPATYEGENCQLNSNPCEPNPCETGAQCTQLGYDFQCQCPQFRTGKRCQLEKTSSCDRNPCQNGGTCRESNLGTFFCLCRPGYQGNVCETSLDPCQPNPCQNGGECISKKPNYQCKCPDNFYGTNCEKSTFGFGELSYMKFASLDPNTNDISITFSTLKENSLLIYNYGRQSGGRSDFLAIELVEGKAVFSFGGARTAITKISINKYLSSGRWYKVTATRNNRVASLSIEDCTESGEFCKLCQAGDEKCFAKDIGESGTLNFNSNLLNFGGINEVQPIVSRAGQVSSDDFIGCVKSLTINGQQMNLKTSFIESHGILASCPIPGSLCAGTDCSPGQCREINWRPVCECSAGVFSRDCTDSLNPISLEPNGTVTFKPSDIHRRNQLFRSKTGGENKNTTDRQEIGFSFRTENPEGQLLVLETVTDSEYTALYVKSGKLVFETKKNSFPLINVSSTYDVIDGEWHVVRISRVLGVVGVWLDEEKVGYQLEQDSTHDFLDPYLANLQFGGKRPFDHTGFRGCLVNLTVNGAVQSFNGSNRLFADPDLVGSVRPDCPPSFLAVTAGSDPVNIGVVIVIVFFIILIIAILGSFFAFKMKKRNYKHMQDSRITNDSMNQVLNNKSAETFNRAKKLPGPGSQPDLLGERGAVNSSPIGYSARDDLPDYSASMVMGEQPEHYDLENASSIAPSDIDIIYHYKDYRDGGRHARELNMGWGKLNNKNNTSNNNSPIRLNSLSNNKMQSTPLARLSPSSELSHQTPRILTLQDISGKPLQSAFLQNQRHSQRAAHHQMGQLSDSSGSDLNSSSRARRRRKKRGNGGAGDTSGRNSSQLDGGISEASKSNKFNDLLDTNTELLHDGDTSDSPSENDSFTCSEYEYETPFNGAKPATETPSGGMVFRKLNASDSDKGAAGEGVEGVGRGGSLSTLNVSDDELSGITSPSGPTSWETLLNWSPSFNSFLGVFRDIAELPDSGCDIRRSPLGDAEGEGEEEYI